MRQFTEEEAKAIEVDAAKRFDGRTMPFDVPEFDIRVVVAPHDRESYAAHYDKEFQDKNTAYHGAMILRLLHPDLVTLEGMRQACAMLPEHVANALDAEAGIVGTETIDPLDLGLLPAGLDAATASKLVADAGKAKLWVLQRPEQGLVCIMKAPLADVWIAARTLYGDALAKARGIVASLEPYILSTIVWSTVPLAVEGSKSGLLDTKPGIFWGLKRCYMRMGGDGAAVRRKSLRECTASNPGGAKPSL